MAFDQVKTQVLLLHSEQSTLDNLSTGFNDSYTVHCATSGTEALNTLGDTPIHVIVSAQDLPGMSGVEALREAKKRSPETIGILLTSQDDDDIEALVGSKEVFQIVRGGISAQDISKLVDNATQQMRLLALAESANDTAANPDEPHAEHIVMETSENGSTIISDGTGQVPVLDPKKISAAAAAGAQSVDVLVLTKDEEFLATVKESSRGMHNIRYANTLAQAEQALAKFKIGVAVVDAAMVGPNVEKLTEHLRGKTSRLVNIVAGRRDDGEMLMDLINRGKVYRFLLKPVSPGRARLAVEASVKHHLEAPDSAFKVVATQQAAPAKPAAKPKPKPAPKPAPRPAAKAKPAPQAQPKPQAKPAASAKPIPPAAPAKAAKPQPQKESAAEPQIEITPSLENDRLAGAFDGDDSSFTETMTGIVANIGDKLKGRKNKAKPEAAAAPAATPAASSDGSDGSLFANPKFIGVAAGVVVAVIAVGYFVFGGSDEPDLTIPQTANDTTLTTDPLNDDAVETETAPPADTGFEIDTGLSAEEIELALANAEAAMLDKRSDDAAAALASVRSADPNNARLPFLMAQLAQMQLRENLDGARAAIRDGRLEDASNAIARARALDIPDTTEIEIVAGELQAAQSEQRVEVVLAEAVARFESGDLVTPANDNARYYYDLVLRSDPDNAAATQGLASIASKLVLQARAEIDANRFDAAAALLADARRVDPNSGELAAATQALNDAEDRVADEARRQQEQRQAAARAEAEREAAAEREAEREAAIQRQAELDRQAELERQQAAARQQAADEAAAAAAAEQAAVDNRDQITVEIPEKQAASNAGPAVGPSAGDTAASAAAMGPQIPPPDAQPAAPVAVSSLTRTRYVAPKYPRIAERRNLSGWVDIVFTVDIDGTTKNIEIRASEPGDTFVNAATKAVEKWEFMPIFENGVVVEKRAGVRMMFAIE